MRIHFERAGGFAAPAMKRACTVDTAHLPPDEARELTELVDRAELPRLAAEPAAPTPAAHPGRDVFHYRLTLEGAEQNHTVVASDANMPETVRPLVHWLSQRAKPGQPPG